MEIIAIPATEENVKPFGRFQRVKNGGGLRGDGWESWMTDDTCLEGPVHFGICACPCLPAALHTLLRCTGTEEMLLCSDQPIAFAVAEHTGLDRIQAFIIYPGDRFILSRGIWHSKGYGTQSNTAYYFLTTDGNEDKPFQVSEIPPVLLKLPSENMPGV